MKKSYLVQFLLSFFFGPLGMFYSSASAAIAFLIAAIIFGGLTYGVALVVIYPLTIVVSLVMVSKHNQKIEIEAKRHEELVQAVAAQAVKAQS